MSYFYVCIMQKGVGNVCLISVLILSNLGHFNPQAGHPP